MLRRRDADRTEPYEFLRSLEDDPPTVEARDESPSDPAGFRWRLLGRNDEGDIAARENGQPLADRRIHFSVGTDCPGREQIRVDRMASSRLRCLDTGHVRAQAELGRYILDSRQNLERP